MRQRLLLFFFVCIALGAKSQNRFRIDGSFQKFNGKIYLYFSGKVDSTDVKDGLFSFTGYIDHAQEANLQISRKSPIAYTPFILDPADIKMAVDTSTQGSKTDRYLWMKALVIEGGESITLLNKFQELAMAKVMAAKGDQAQMAVLVEEGKKFYTAHKGKVASLSIIANAVNTLDNSFLRKLYFELPDSLKNTSYANKIKRKLDKDNQAIIGQTIKGFKQKDIKGDSLDIKSLRGKFVLIDFWASWCKPCRLQNPQLAYLNKKYHNSGFRILSISLDEERKSWLEAIKNDRMTWLNVSDLGGWNNEIANLFKIYSVPDNILINKDGIIVAKGIKVKDLDQLLANALSIPKQ
jgi:thiol-disulfide isomerase/thioredoxin